MNVSKAMNGTSIQCRYKANGDNNWSATILKQQSCCGQLNNIQLADVSTRCSQGLKLSTKNLHCFYTATATENVMKCNCLPLSTQTSQQAWSATNNYSSTNTILINPFVYKMPHTLYLKYNCVVAAISMSWSENSVLATTF